MCEQSLKFILKKVIIKVCKFICSFFKTLCCTTLYFIMWKKKKCCMWWFFEIYVDNNITTAVNIATHEEATRIGGSDTGHVTFWI